MMKLAIDFGTTNTVVATLNEHELELVHIPGLSNGAAGQPPLIPSLVYVRDGQAARVHIGQTIREQRLDQQPDNRFFRNFKRGIVAAAATDSMPRLIDGRSWTDRDASESYVRGLLAALPLALPDIDRIVLTAPVSAVEPYLTWLGEVLGDSLSNTVYIVDESTAAALGYAVTEPGAAVLVLDFGGGTLDLSLVQLPEGRSMTGGILNRLSQGRARARTARVIAKAGRVIGGSDVDHWLLAALLERVGASAEALARNYAALLTRCEQAKISLSTETATNIEFDLEGTRHSLQVTRGELETLLEAHGFYDAIRYAVDKVMHVAHRSGLYREDVKHVLLVGGVSMMPSVQATLKQYFGDEAVRSEKPFTAVAEGALQVAAGYGLDDYLEQGFALRYRDVKSGQARYEELIPHGSRYPSDTPIELIVAAAHEDQKSIELVVGEISNESGASVAIQYEGGQTVFVANRELDARSQAIMPLNADDALRLPLEPAGVAGEDRLRLRFTVDEKRRLRVNAYDLKLRRVLIEDAAVVGQRTSAMSSPANAAAAITGLEPALGLNEGSRGQQRLSLRGLGSMLKLLPPDAVSLDAVEAALRSESFKARYGAVEILSKRQDREARLVIQRVLTDGAVPARASAARLLHNVSWYSAEPLLRQALDDSDSRVREAVMYALSDMREPSAYKLMSEALQSEADNVREAAAFGLRDCQHPDAVPALEACLLAQDAEVRVKALEALSVNDSTRSAQVVRTALDDPDPTVVYAAVLSLLELLRENSLVELAGRIVNTSGMQREAVLRALFHGTNYLNIDLAAYPDPALMNALSSALEDELPEVRRAAIWPLAWMRTEAAADSLVRAFRAESDQSIKAALVRVAVSLMSKVGEKLLAEALQDRDDIVRQTAEHIVQHREQTGIVLEYDDEAAPGTGLEKPSLGR